MAPAKAAAMAIPTDIRQRGFSKWYERELLRSHSHLVLLILCALAVLGAVEVFSQGGDARLLMVLSLLVAAAVGVWALRRYLFYLSRAELIANQASCPGCGVHGRWTIETSESGQTDEPSQPAVMAVCCRRCAHRWRIEW
jgi:hypothetical protein